MSEQNSGSNRPQNGGGSPGNNPSNRRHHHNRNRRPQGQGGQGGQGPGQNADRQPQVQRSREGQQSGGQPQQVRPPGSGNNNNRRRHRGGQNRNRSQGVPANAGGHSGGALQHTHGINLERIYEKYLNLLDQHLIARRKYHDMFYRTEPAQKAKLERNFYNTLNDIREFENKLAPEARELFEKRNNGLRPDTIYTSNHQIVENGPLEGEKIIEAEGEDPHFLQSQRAADFRGDTEESVGTVDDYLRYKNLV